MADPAAYDADKLAAVLGDFRSFCSLISIRIKDGGALIPFDYESWFDEQKTFERNRTGRDVVLKPRQIGFSTVELARDLWFPVTHKGFNTLVLAHDADLSSQLFETLLIFKDCLTDLRLFPATRYSNKREIVFKDLASAVRIDEAGSTKRSAQGKGRSGTIHRLHCTEVAFWQSAYDTLGGVMPSAKNADSIVFESTANGEGGLFHSQVLAAQVGKSGDRLHFFAWFEHKGYEEDLPEDFDDTPRDEHEAALLQLGVTDRQLQWWRSMVDNPAFGLERILQDYPYSVETCFRSGGDEFMNDETRLYLSGTVRSPLRLAPLKWKGQDYGEARIYATSRANRRYVIGADIAEGLGDEKDYSAAVVLDRQSGEMCAVYARNDLEPGDFAYGLAVLGFLYNIAELGPESNNHGHTVIRTLRKELKYPSIYQAKNLKGKAVKWGWETNLATRPPLFDDLYMACKERSYECPDAETCSEARTLVRGDNGRPVARNKGKKGGAHDDRFVAWAIAHQLRSVPAWTGGSFTVRGL